MQDLAQLHTYLLESPEVQGLLGAVATELHQRNLAPLSGVTTYSGKAIASDPFTANYAKLLKLIRNAMLQTDLNSLASIADKKIYDNFRAALWFGEADNSFNIDRSLIMVAAYLLEMHTPNIDEYVARMEDYELSKSLGLAVDEEGLITIGANMELKKHGLVLPLQEKMIYPHQFLRRFYRANFVDMLSMLGKCDQDDMTVKVRIDPMRVTHPKYYRNIFEADYWYGPEFAESLLQSKDTKPVRTLHRTDSKQDFTYPVNFTLFRTEMMSSTERQFMVEEYVPLKNPKLPTQRVSGVGKKYCIQKFAHFVYDQERRTISHVDGAVRVFAVKDYAEILDKVTKGSEPGKRIGKRYKLFKVEGALDVGRVRSLLYEFFMYNPHIGEYFSASTT